MNNNSNRYLTDPKRVKAFHNSFIESEAAMRTSILLLSFITTLIIISSCDSATGPEEPPPGRRDYVWEVDTIDPGPGYYTYGFNLWGAAPDDVWFIGGATTRKDPIWHYDGEKWTNVVLDEFITGAGIWGFSRNNVWMGTTNSSIWHYDGTTWSKFASYEIEGYQNVVIQSIHGIKEDEIYGVGVADNTNNPDLTRIIMKYDGTDWTFIDIPKLQEAFVQVIVDKRANDVLILSRRRGIPGNFHHLYVLKDDSLSLLYTSEELRGIDRIGNKSVAYDNQIIYEYKNGKLELLVDLQGTDYVGRAWGRSENDFFTVNSMWRLGHYNGSDLKSLFTLNAVIGQVIVFEKEVFAFGTDITQPRDFILRGKLKN